MNKKYIDFVPKTEAPRKRSVTTVRSVQRVTEVSELEISDMFEARDKKPQAGVTVSSKKQVGGDLRPRFVKTEVEKRPLSKNVYPKKVVPKEEKPTKPVTIIHKPEKDSKVGLVVTIIITIILGAAAGTVAFLLLPK